MAERLEQQGNPAFRARRIITRHEERIAALPDRIFPLLCPIEEYKWIDEWECELVYSESGVVEDNCVFREELSAPLLFGAPGRTTWITTLHDPENFRRHFLIVNEEAVRKAEVSIEASHDGTSKVRWTSVATTLNETGNGALESLERGTQLMLRFLGASLRRYCETGEMLRKSEFSPLQDLS